ncbi:hypothetical protein KEM56_000133 [Ascosphaera pollenicola]|nr:hypothetical protein KEM56_000133 [Ascosphaera pollenicola]
MGSISSLKPLRSLPIDITVRHQDPFVYIRRQEKSIEKDLQYLLDVQSAKLQAQLSGNVLDDASPANSASSSMVFHHSRAAHDVGVTVPVRQPKSPRLGLGGARKGILRDMESLLYLKQEERNLIADELKKRDAALADTNGLMTRRRELEESMATVSNEQGQLHLGQLVNEAQTLEQEIHQLEMKLMDMKARHRRLTDEIAKEQSSADARLSSYRASLSLLDSESRSFLRSLPFPPILLKNTLPPFYAVDPRRRTLQMAKEQWLAEKSFLENKLRQVDDEMDALYEGGSLWQEVIATIYAFEKRLRKEVSSRLSSRVKSSILRDLRRAIKSLEGALHVTEAKGWNLLICCIGAELAAFHEAQRLMSETEAEDNARLAHNEPPQNGQGGVPVTPEQGLQDGKTTHLEGQTAERATEITTTTIARNYPETANDLIPETEEGTGLASSSSQDRTGLDDEPDPAWL